MEFFLVESGILHRSSMADAKSSSSATAWSSPAINDAQSSASVTAHREVALPAHGWSLTLGSHVPWEREERVGVKGGVEQEKAQLAAGSHRPREQEPVGRGGVGRGNASNPCVCPDARTVTVALPFVR